MGVWTRILLTLFIVSIPATGAFAAGKPSHVVDKSDKTAAEATKPAPPEECLDMTSVEQLRAASFDDLSPSQLNTLDREVTRMRALRDKYASDGNYSDKDKERVAKQAVRSCQKIMTPGQVTQPAMTERARRITTNTGRAPLRR